VVIVIVVERVFILSKQLFYLCVLFLSLLYTITVVQTFFFFFCSICLCMSRFFFQIWHFVSECVTNNEQYINIYIYVYKEIFGKLNNQGCSEVEKIGRGSTSFSKIDQKKFPKIGGIPANKNRRWLGNS
jgi:hypothetical protein